MVKFVGNRDENFMYFLVWILDWILLLIFNVKRVVVEDGVKLGRFGVVDNEEYSVFVVVIFCNRVGFVFVDVDWFVVGIIGGGFEEVIVWGIGIFVVDSFFLMICLYVVLIIGVIEFMYVFIKFFMVWFVDVEGWMFVEGDCIFFFFLGLVVIFMYNNK